MHVATVTIDHTKVAGDLTDYVVYVDLSHLPLDFWDVVLNGGGDIRVYKDDDTTELAREVVSCVTASDTGELHLKFAGTLSSTVDTDIHIYADGTSSEPVVTATYGRNAVWSDYEAVWHMNDNTSTTVNDSTDGSWNLTKGGANQPNEVSGKLGQAQDFTTSNFYMQGSTSTTLNPTGDCTIQNWFKTPSHTSSGMMIGKDDETGYDRNGFVVTADGLTGFVSFSAGDSSRVGANYPNVISSNDWQNDQWHMLHSRYITNTEIRIFVDGVSDGFSTAVNPTLGTVTRALQFGRRLNGFGPDRYYIGEMDEVRIRKSALTANWITTEYNNQNSPSTFYSATAATSGTTVSPAAQVLTASLPAATVQIPTTIAVNPQTLTASTPVTTITANWTVNVANQTVTLDIPAYIVSAGGIILTPDAQVLSLSLPAETIQSSANVSVNGQQITLTIPAPTITADWVVAVEAQSLTISVPTLAFIGAVWSRLGRNAGDWTRSPRNNDY